MNKRNIPYFMKLSLADCDSRKNLLYWNARNYILVLRNARVINVCILLQDFCQSRDFFLLAIFSRHILSKKYGIFLLTNCVSQTQSFSRYAASITSNPTTELLWQTLSFTAASADYTVIIPCCSFTCNCSVLCAVSMCSQLLLAISRKRQSIVTNSEVLIWWHTHPKSSSYLPLPSVPFMLSSHTGGGVWVKRPVTRQLSGSR